MDLEFDVVIAGGGFSGVYSLIHLRKLGYRCKLIEPGSAFGGAWHWNRYPGARVDSEVPVYEFPFDDLPKGWTWSERFPGSEELRAYFAYVAKKYDLARDAWMDSRVAAAHWSEDRHAWDVTAESSGEERRQITCRYLIMALVSTGGHSYSARSEG